MYHLLELKRVRENLMQNKQSLESELRILPEGLLYSYRSGNGRMYYGERIPATGNRKKAVRKGISNDKEKLKGLVRKKYVTEAISILDVNIRKLDSMISKYIPSDEQSLMKGFATEHPEISGFIYCDNDHGWTTEYERNEDMYSGNLKSTSSDGVRMRSMGEIAIASRLDHFKIPYRYEASLGIPEVSYIPDFTIKRPRDGMLFYWEHLGMVSDRDYMRHNRHKMDVYEEYGIVPWRNLIVTYGNEDGGINMKMVDAMIHGWLL